MSYNPNPTRAWSRVQGQCTYNNNDSSNNAVYIPLINKTVTSSEALYYDKLQYKGNILQYKSNSIGLTKRQKYSQIAKGLGPSRTKVFATQTQTYSNPNTSSLLRVGTTTYPYPNNIVGAPNNPAGPFQYNVANPFNCATTDVVDGGSLINGVYANPCSNAIIKDTNVNQQCFPTYCSDVPGKPELLCWNPKQQTWYPRQRVNMNNSLNKWPEGYKGFVSAICNCFGLSCYNVNGLVTSETTSGIIKVLSGSNGTIIFRHDVILTEVFLVGGGNAGLSGKSVGGNNGGWGGAGGGWAKINNISIIHGTPITLTVGAGGVYLVSNSIQSSFTYNGNTTLSLSNGTDWNASQNNSGGLNNGYSTGSNVAAQNGYQYDGIWYGGGGGYGGRNATWLQGGTGGNGGGGGGGGYTGYIGGSGGGGSGGTFGTSTVNAGGASNFGGGGGYGDASGNGFGGFGGTGGGGLGGAGGAGSGGGGGGGVNTGGGGGGGGFPENSGMPGNGGSGIIIIKYTI